MKNIRPLSEYEKSQPGGNAGSFDLGLTPFSCTVAPLVVAACAGCAPPLALDARLLLLLCSVSPADVVELVSSDATADGSLSSFDSLFDDASLV